MNATNEERVSSGINILWPIVSNKHFIAALEEAKNGGGQNNISPIVVYSFEDSATVMWTGDLETEFMENIEDEL